MQIKVTIEYGFKHEGDTFEFEDVRTVNDEDGEYFCRAGWAEDLSGKIETASPSTTDVVLKVQGNKQDTTTENI